MKKAKLLIAALLSSGLVLSGCTFEEGLKMVKGWASSNVVQPASSFFNEKILGKKPEEAKPAEKEEKQDEEGKEQQEEQTPVATLLSISVSGEYKTEYSVGDSFDPTGIVVTAAYDDESTKDVSSEAQFSGFSSEEIGTCTVTVSFEGQTAEIELSILKAFAPFPSDTLAAFYAAEGAANITVPAFVTANRDIEYVVDDSYVSSYGYLFVRINGSNQDEFDAYVELMGNSGWAITDGDFAGDYVATFALDGVGAVLEIQNYLDYGGYIKLVAYVTILPTTTFPAEQIAADLASLEITDTLPAFEGTANGFQYSAEYHQLAILVDEGSESSAITSYQGTLATALFTELGADSYGDMHYASPNNQMDVCVWNGDDIGYPGYVLVDIEKIVEPVAAFPFAEVNAFLEEYGLGFELSSTLQFPGTSFTASPVSVSGGYHYIMVEIEGDVVSGVDDVLGPIVTAAGYQLYSEAEYIDYYNSAYHEVQIKLVEGNTRILFWE